MIVVSDGLVGTPVIVVWGGLISRGSMFGATPVLMPVLRKLYKEGVALGNVENERLDLYFL